jgi:carboxypeptidase PM20D1
MRRWLLVAATPLVVLLAVLVVRTARFTSRQVRVEPVRMALPVDRLVERLAQAVRIRTVSHERSADTDAQTRAFHAFLAAAFPRVHAALGREVVGGGSLVYTWRGRAAASRPVLLAAHLDVVPVDPSTAGEWTHPPFAGAVAGGYVWGRGALDDKAGLMAMLEAVEMLLAEGYEPQRTFLVAVGHDEELGGGDGARQVAALLRERGVRPEFVLDEGLAIAAGIIPAIPMPVAVVGIAEKGYVTVELVVDGEGGHSSMPPPQSTIGILAAAVARLEAHPAPGRLEGATRRMFEVLGPEMPLGPRFALANLWLFGWLVERQLAATPSTNALLRTTTAVTLVEGGVKENVLPTRARAVVHFRIRPGETIAEVVAHAQATVNDPRVRFRQLEAGSEPSPASDTASAGYAGLGRSIRQVFPDVVVAPSLTIGATDARYYAPLSENTFRFRPLRLGPRDLRRIHGTDERIAVENYADLVRFYVQLIRNSDLRRDRATPPAR